MKFFIYRDFAALRRALPAGCPLGAHHALLDSVRSGTISDIEAAETAQAIAAATPHPPSPQALK